MSYIRASRNASTRDAENFIGAAKKSQQFFSAQKIVQTQSLATQRFTGENFFEKNAKSFKNKRKTARKPALIQTLPIHQHNH